MRQHSTAKTLRSILDRKARTPAPAPAPIDDEGDRSLILALQNLGVIGDVPGVPVPQPDDGERWERMIAILDTSRKAAEQAQAPAQAEAPPLSAAQALTAELRKQAGESHGAVPLNGAALIAKAYQGLGVAPPSGGDAA